MRSVSHIIHTLLAWIARYWLAFTLLLMAIICLLTLWPADKMVQVGGSDKVYHLVAYLSLTFPAAYMRPPTWKWVAVLLVAMGGAIELIQPFVMRSREFGDFSANAAGVMLGIAIAMLCRYWWPVSQPMIHKKTDA